VSQLVHLKFAPEDVRSTLEEAAAIVAELELDDDLKVHAFDKAVELLAGKHLTVETPPSSLLGQPPLRLG
jgi:hypothetical protein